MDGLCNLRATLPEGALPPGTAGRILTSALRAFAEVGYEGTSTRRIAAGVGINSATVYSHFASKAEILSALVTIGAQELLERIQAAIEGASSPTERLDAIIRATVQGHAEFPLLAIVTNTEIRSLAPEDAAAARRPVEEAAAMLRKTLADGLAGGEFDLQDADIAAHALEGLAVGIPYWFDPAVHDPKDLAAQYVAIARRIVHA